MNWEWFSPTRVIFGEGAVLQSCDYLKKAGRKALIVIGKGGSARRNGALNDVCTALDKCLIQWEVFDEIEANPSVAVVRNGAITARNNGADFIVGIGGGSPLDAAKAIAVLAVNDLSDEELFDLKFSQVLPIFAVPTTAGTGSEVTPYSILTYPEIESKKSIASPLIIPMWTAIDAAYTRDLPMRITIDTAVDAFTHVFEGYLSHKASVMSDAVSREALRILGKELRKLAENRVPDIQGRANLLYASMLAGMVISQTGTSIPHALGYSLTYFKDISHGRANGLITPAYAQFNLENSDGKRTAEAMEAAHLEGLQDLRSIMNILCGTPDLCTEEEIKQYVRICSQAKNIRNNIVVPNEVDLEKIYKQALHF